MYNIYHDYECYIQYIQLSKEVLLKYHPRAEGPRVIFQQNFRGQLYILYIARIIMIYVIYFMSIFLLCNFSSHFEVGVQYTPTFLSMRSCNLWSPHALRLFLLLSLSFFVWLTGLLNN